MKVKTRALSFKAVHFLNMVLLHSSKKADIYYVNHSPRQIKLVVYTLKPYEVIVSGYGNEYDVANAVGKRFRLHPRTISTLAEKLMPILFMGRKPKPFFKALREEGKKYFGV